MTALRTAAVAAVIADTGHGVPEIADLKLSALHLDGDAAGGQEASVDLDGESFLSLAANRFGGEGVYLLDEPEAALSVTGALALLAVIVRAARAGAQSAIGARRDRSVP